MIGLTRKFIVWEDYDWYLRLYLWTRYAWKHHYQSRSIQITRSPYNRLQSMRSQSLYLQGHHIFRPCIDHTLQNRLHFLLRLLLTRVIWWNHRWSCRLGPFGPRQVKRKLAQMLQYARCFHYRFDLALMQLDRSLRLSPAEQDNYPKDQLRCPSSRSRCEPSASDTANLLIQLLQAQNRVERITCLKVE